MRPNIKGDHMDKNAKQNKLAGKISKLEGGKSQAKVGDINTVLKVIKKIIFQELEANDTSTLGLILGDYLKKYPSVIILEPVTKTAKVTKKK
jgi:hypothetical protein